MAEREAWTNISITPLLSVWKQSKCVSVRREKKPFDVWNNASHPPWSKKKSTANKIQLEIFCFETNKL